MGAADPSGRGFSALLIVVAVACVVVPAAFTTRIQAVFVVPKLGVLWGLLAVCICVVAVRTFLIPEAMALRPYWVVDAAVLSFVVLTTLAWLSSSDGEQSLYGERLQHQGLLTTLLYVAWFYVARLAISRLVDLRILVAAAAAGGGVVAGYALAQRAGADPIWDGYLPGGRVFSAIGQSNALAAYLVLVGPLAASFAFDARRIVKVASLLASGVILLAFTFTQSRGGYLGLVAAGIVLAVGWRDELRIRQRAVAWAVVGVVTIVIIATLAASGQFARLGSATDASARFHLDAWRIAAEIAKDHPVFGTGPETFPDILPRYAHDVLPAERADDLDAFRVESPHNVYLGIAAGSGIPALIAYLVAVAGVVVVSVRALGAATRTTKLAVVAVLGALAGHLVTAAFMSPEVTSSWLAWLLLGGLLGMVVEEHRQDERARTVDLLHGKPRRRRGA